MERRTYNPCDECPYGIERRDGSGNDAMCRICEFNAYLKLGPIDHLRDLIQAEEDGLVRILPKGEDGTCGGCGHFKRIPGKRCGTCEVRPNYTDRRGNIEAHRGTFTPSQSRKCCKQYIPRNEAEAAK